jgi:hypothetical protein
MIEELGAGKYALPVVAVVLVGCLMALMFTPMLKMSPHELPFAVLSLDEGAQTPDGEVNAGAQKVEQLTGQVPGEGETAPIVWHEVSSQTELDAALEDNEYYGAVTIPADFTQGQSAAQAGQGEAPPVAVVLDNARSPLVATQMQTAMSAQFSELGIGADVTVIHTGESESTSASPMAGMMSQQIGIMPLVMMSMIGSILLRTLVPVGAARSRGGRFTALGTQLLVAAGISLLAALTTVVLLNTLVEASAPVVTTTGFLWLGSFAIMALLLGAFGIAAPLGALIAVCVFALGMMTGALPVEMLPPFWADYVAPWAPQHFLGNGIRDVLYMGAGLLPRGSGGLLAIAGVGIALLVVAGLLPRRPRRSEEPAMALSGAEAPAGA